MLVIGSQTEMIDLHFKYDEDDYLPAMRKYVLQKPKFIGLFVFVYLLTLGLLMLLPDNGADFQTAWFVGGAIVSLLGLIGLLLYVLPHRWFQQSYRAMHEYWFHVDLQGITYESEYENVLLPWRRCTKLMEGHRFYVFEHDHRRVTVLPKRAFQNKTEENAFRTIMRNTLPPALSSKLLRDKELEPGEDYVPPDRAPDWR